MCLRSSAAVKLFVGLTVLQQLTMIGRVNFSAPFSRMTATACLAALSAGCAAPPLDAARLPAIGAAIDKAHAERKLPGAAFRLERHGAFHESFHGRLSFDETAEAVGARTVYDAASLTKVLATAPAVLLLAEEGKVGLDDPLSAWFPDCAAGGLGALTVRQLLTHTSGLPSGLKGDPPWSGADAAYALACSRTLTHDPGTFFRYSDVNYVLLGRLVASAAGMPFERYVQERLFVPLGMADTGFLPLQRIDSARIAPTAPQAQYAPGIVHDPTARRMGGVAGSAGVFTTTADVARFARMLLAGGMHEGVQVLAPASVRLMSTVQTPPGIKETRAMGMDIGSPFSRPRGDLFPATSYGHTGFTGCILWIDPVSQTFYVFLSNRVYPDMKSNIVPLYGELGTLAARAVTGADFKQK